MAQIEKRDLVLPPGAFAYMQDVTTGMVKTFVGPCVINQTAQELPVIYDPRDKRFRICSSLEEAVCKVPVAVEGSYLVLLNPAVASGEEHPQPGNSGKPSPSLQVGRKINIPGPVMFALWPGQEGKVVKGHHLRSNQYLIARVYNEEEARKNWPRAVVKGAEEETTIAVPADLTVGRQIVIKGTEVSFYMPPTGVSVVVDEKGSYVREALTLERLEYAILIDEDGNKRYERGPQVVFPEPTEQFAESGGQIKFRAVELNEIQGLHIKVIAPYNDGADRKEGDELFLTGRDVQIYFPREEHAIIKYDGAAKHFATAVPVGEGRYVMNRLTGEIETVRGPNMLLPDPRTRVIVRRVLSDRECGMWYPDNVEVREYNANLRQVVSQAPTTRSGVVSEGDYARHAGKGGRNLMKGAVAYSANMAMEESRSTRDQRVVAEELSRNASYTEPRTITLSSKLAGVPGIEVWPGYAVLVKNKTGARRVVVGPASILLDYDETLEVMELSTGKPKATDHLLRTVFLKHAQNLVTDIISGVETTDHFTLTIKLQFRAKFTGDDKLRWFEGGNYVKLLCDHVRSMVKARVRGFNLRDFYGDSEKILRDLVLGVKPEDGSDRPGLRFEENGLSVYELEVLSVNIEDEDVQGAPRRRSAADDARHPGGRAGPAPRRHHHRRGGDQQEGHGGSHGDRARQGQPQRAGICGGARREAPGCGPPDGRPDEADRERERRQGARSRPGDVAVGDGEDALRLQQEQGRGRAQQDAGGRAPARCSRRRAPQGRQPRAVAGSHRAPRRAQDGGPHRELRRPRGAQAQGRPRHGDGAVRLRAERQDADRLSAQARSAG